MSRCLSGFVDVCSAEGGFDLVNKCCWTTGTQIRRRGTAAQTLLQRAKGSCGKSKCARWPDSLSRRSYCRRQDLFNSENATHIPVAQTATAQKSPRHYNANVVGGFDFFQPLQRSCSLWQPRRRSSPGVLYPAFHASPHLAGALEKAERVLSVKLKL